MGKFFKITLSLILIGCIFLGNLLFFSVNDNQVVSTINMADKKAELTVMMYHHILETKSRWGDYVISPTEFEDDLKYIKENGYTTVTVKQILDFYESNIPLPSKSVLITFDDGYESVHEYAYPLLEKYGMTAVVSLIGKYTDLYSSEVVKHINYSHLSWTQVNEMLESGVFEVGNHTYEMHENVQGARKGIKMLSTESEYEYEEVLNYDIKAFNEQILAETGVASVVFAYPFGAYSGVTDKILKKMGFKIIFTCEQKANILESEKYSEDGLIRLNRYNRLSGKGIDNFL